MFNSAVICLIVAVVAALCGYGGLPDAEFAALAQHVFLIAVGGFVVTALSVITGIDEVALAGGNARHGDVAGLVQPDVKA